MLRMLFYYKVHTIQKSFIKCTDNKVEISSKHIKLKY